MKTFNARVAIYCDVPIEVPDNFDYENYDADELIDKVFDKTPDLYNPNTGRPEGDFEIEVVSIWDEEDNCLYTW